MDVSVNPVLESVRPFFQGLPAPASNAGGSPASVPAPPPSHPAAATPVQPSPSPSVLSYWPQPQRTKDKSPALASPLHHVYNGTKLPEPQQPSAQHNLPPIAALSNNYHSRTVLRQSYHHGVYSPPSSQSVSRSSSGSSPSPHPYSYSPRTSMPMSTASYPQTTSASPRTSLAMSTASYPQTTSSSPRTSLAMSSASYPQTTPASPRTSLAMSSASYPQTTSASPAYVSSSLHLNHQLPSHHPMSPVIQQPSQSQEHKPHQQPSNFQYSSHQLHPGQQSQPNNTQQSRTNQLQSLGNQQHLSYQQHSSSLQKDPSSHILHSSHQQNPPSNQHPGSVQHSSHEQQPSNHQSPGSHQQHVSSIQQHSSAIQQHTSAIQQHTSHQPQPNSNQHRAGTPQHHSSVPQQSNVPQQQLTHHHSHPQPNSSSNQHQHTSELISYPQHPSSQQQPGGQQKLHQYNTSHQHNSVPSRPPSQQQPSHQQHSSSQQHMANYQQQKTLSQHQQNHVQQMLQQQSQQARQEQQTAMSQQQRQQMLSQQHHQQLQQQAAMYNQTVQQSSSRSHQQQLQQQQQQHQQQQTQQQQQQQHQRDTEKLAEMEQMLRMKQRQLAAVQAQQQAYYAAVSSNSSRSQSQTTTTTTEASNHQRTTPSQALMGGVKRESPLDLSVKTVRQSADSTAKDDAESAYYANIQSHEAFLHRSKSAPKTASPRNSVPPLQLPSTIVYPHFDNHAANQNSSSGAPKVDFLPNFNAHHSSSSVNSGSFQDPNKRQRKSSTSQLPSPSQYPPRIGSLPHMGSFKRSSLPSAAYDDPNKQSQYYPATGPPNMQRSTSAIPNHSSMNVQPSYSSTTSSQYPYDPLKRGSSARYDMMERHSSSSTLQSSSSLESNYLLGKRQSSSTDLRHPLPPKIPKVVDTWRQTIDQQIEQRLNSYASSRGHQINGVSKESSLPNSSGIHQQTASPYSTASKSQSASHSSVTLPSSNSLGRSSSLFSSQLPNSSKTNLPSQNYPHSPHLSQYMSQGMQPRSLQEPYNNLSQVKLPSLPSNGAADKRVLSILRKRLDTREATNQLVQQQMQQSSLQDRSKMYSSRGYPQPLVVPSPQSKYPPQATQGRHNLPPFNALNLERNAGIAYPSQKLHIPKAMDSVVPDHTQSHFPTRDDGVLRTPLAPRTEIVGKLGAAENAGDFDGLAAFLAARIRTKAELKQVGPSMDLQNQPRTPTPASASTSPRATPAVFSPPHHFLPDIGKRTPTSESGASSSGHSGSSPLKNSRDKYGINSPRRRLFGDQGPSESVVQAREAGLRSSSETSVFDFRESDSEGEAGLERQSLTDMRKDRDRRLQERQQLPATSPDVPPQVCDSDPIDDSFWSGMCDQFVSQLEKGGNKVRKRGRRKKVEAVSEFKTFETTEDALRAFYDIKPEEIASVNVKPEENNTPVTPAVVSTDVDDSSRISKIEAATPLTCKQEESGISQIEVTNIKLEKVDDQNSDEIQEEHTVEEEKMLIPAQQIKVEEESSDEDAPLALRQVELKKSMVKLENISEKDCILTKDSQKDKLCLEVDKTKKDDVECEDLKHKAIKKEVSDSEGESSADENSESVAKRLRMRKPKDESSKETKRKTRSKEKETSEKENSLDRSTTPQKGGRKKKEKEEKKKSLFGDGSEFRPGWEAEVYRYKRSLRMPTSLINIAGPQSWPSPKLSVSLPDLDPDSPMTLDSELSMQNKKMESDGESTPRKSKSPVRIKNKLSQKKGEEKFCKGEEDSFLNRLIQRYGGKGKKSLRKGLEKDGSKERKGPKIIPQSNELQLLPTPSLDCIVKSSPLKRTDQAQSKQSKSKKSNKDEDKSEENEIKESIFLGYFRKKTVTDFSNVFAKHNGGFATEHELPPIMLKSRTRTQTRILTQRATIREVFGEDRPASAPPAGCREDIEENNKDSEEKKLKKPGKKSKALLNKRNSTNGITGGTRSGLRSAAVLRSNKAVLKSKQQLLHGGERRKRSKDLIKAFKTSKNHQQEAKIKEEVDVETTIKCEPQDTSLEDEVPVLVNEKRLKYRSVRRKLKSSGFDYIRKKKKQQQKKDGDTDSVKEKKKTAIPKQNLESEEDIQNEIKGWVINKGLGETILHRAARLGYTDIAAYCLEKMDHNPSPRDNAGYTPLHEACSKGRLDIARLLLLYGADVSDSAQGGIRPLHEAAENGCLELIRLLLSYGADPLLATYSGLTPLSLTYNHPEARLLLQNHLADVQGQAAPPWQIQLTDPTLVGNNPLDHAPSPEPPEAEVEVEAAELSLPHLYQLLGEPHTDRWVLFQELCPVLRVKTREALIKQLGPNHRGDFRDLKMTEFYDMARCCSVLGIGDFVLNPKAHKVTLVKYSDRVQALLNSEKTVISR